MAESNKYLDMNDPNVFKAVTRNFLNMYDAASGAVRERGEIWYPDAHKTAYRDAREAGISGHQGTGLIAVASPQLEFEGVNKSIIPEIIKVTGPQWHRIISAAATNTKTPEGISLRQDATKMLTQEHGDSSLPQIRIDNLARAHRVLTEGPSESDVERVFLTNRRGKRSLTGPKTRAFWHNMNNPLSQEHLTIDYRTHDIGSNVMLPVIAKRGIDETNLSGNARYNRIEDSLRAAARARNVLGPAFQAGIWEQAKLLEIAKPTASGEPRKLGVPRRGQAYL